MSDGSQASRRVIRARSPQGGDAVIVLQAAEDGQVAISVTGSALLDGRAIQRAIECLRELEAIALRGTRW